MNAAQLPDLYTRVVAHSPKLAVPDSANGVRRIRIEHGTVTLTTPGYTNAIDSVGVADIAAALIADHWAECLPDGYAVSSGGIYEGKQWWCIVSLSRDTLKYVRWAHDKPEIEGFWTTRLEALAAFFLAQPGVKP